LILKKFNKNVVADYIVRARRTRKREIIWKEIKGRTKPNNLKEEDFVSVVVSMCKSLKNYEFFCNEILKVDCDFITEKNAKSAIFVLFAVKSR
jgi:hypothetical protein